MKNWIRTSLLLSWAGLAGGCQLMVLDDPAKLAELVPQAAEIMAPAPPPLPPEPPLPRPGSEQVSFVDPVSAQLNGCREVSRLNLSYTGTFEDGLVVLKNRSVGLDANRIVALRLVEADAGQAAASHYYRVRFLRCPDRLATLDDAKGDA